MKRKIGILLLTVTAAAAMAAGLAACTSADGASAYDLAVANGFSGTEAEWLETLKGATGETGAQGEQGETGAQGVGIESIEVLNRYNDYVVTYTDGSTQTLSWYGTESDPYEVLAKYLSNGYLYENFNVEAESSAYYTLEITSATKIYFYGIDKEDEPVITDSEEETYDATWDSDYGYYSITLFAGNYSLELANSAEEEIAISIQYAVWGTTYMPYTDEYFEEYYSGEPIAAGATVYYKASESMAYDIMLCDSTYTESNQFTLTNYATDTAIALTWDSWWDAYVATNVSLNSGSILAITYNGNEDMTDTEWYVYATMHEGIGTATDPYLVYGFDFEDDYGNTISYGEGSGLWIDDVAAGDSVYLSVLTGGEEVTLYVTQYLNSEDVVITNGITIQVVTISSEGVETVVETKTLTDGTITISSINRTGALLLKITNTSEANWSYPTVFMDIYDLVVDDEYGIEVSFEGTVNRLKYSYNEVEKFVTISEAGTYRVYVDNIAADVVVGLCDEYGIDYYYFSEADEDGDKDYFASYTSESLYDDDYTYLGEEYTCNWVVDEETGLYYLEFTITEEELADGDVEIAISLSAIIIDDEGEISESSSEAIPALYYNVSILTVEEEAAAE